MPLYFARVAVILVISTLLSRMGHGIQTREYWEVMGLIVAYGFISFVEGFSKK